MHVSDAPARDRGTLAALTDELLVVRATFRVTAAAESPAEAAARLLVAVLPRAVPPAAIDALADDLVPAHRRRGSFTLTDVDVRLWFLAWALEAGEHHVPSRST